jgi:hypothetical protein
VVGDALPELVGVVDGRGGVDPGFQVKAQGAAGPAGAGVCVADAGDGGGDRLIGWRAVGWAAG